MNNERIFKQSTIRSLKGVKFGDDKIHCRPTGVAIYHPSFGYLSLDGNKDKLGVKLPYMPCGGRKALKSILESGLTSYDSIEWIKPL